MAIFTALGMSISRLTVLVVQTNNVVGDSCQKYAPLTPYEEQEGKPPKLDGRFYPLVMHGPEKYYRPIISGNDPFVTADSAKTAAELLIKYINLMDPWPKIPEEEQLELFPELPRLQAQAA